MKLTKSQLKEIIKEELGKVLNEADELQQQLADLNAKADAAKEAGDREAYDALVDQMKMLTLTLVESFHFQKDMVPNPNRIHKKEQCTFLRSTSAHRRLRLKLSWNSLLSMVEMVRIQWTR